MKKANLKFSTERHISRSHIFIGTSCHPGLDNSGRWIFPGHIIGHIPSQFGPLGHTNSEIPSVF
jgi:hypothetical protein